MNIMKDYLTEEKLLIYLQEIFEDEEIIHDRKIKYIKELNTRPDFYLPNKNLIVEFDGYLHYQKSSTIISDFNKDNIYKKYDIEIVRIPYFVQWCSELIKQEFEIESNIDKIYNHGFHDERVIYPADFCELGIAKFKNDLERFSFAKNEILDSFKNKRKELSLPPSLYYLL